MKKIIARVFSSLFQGGFKVDLLLLGIDVRWFDKEHIFKGFDCCYNFGPIHLDLHFSKHIFGISVESRALSAGITFSNPFLK